MTDPKHVADALTALADGTAPESVAYRTVVEDAADAATDVRDAAQFVAGNGRRRLRLAVCAAERAGDRDVAETGRRTTETLAAFRAAAASDDDPPTSAPDTDATPSPPAATDAPLPLRSRNDFTRRRSTTSRRR